MRPLVRASQQLRLLLETAKPNGWFILDPHGLGCGTCVAITLEVVAMRDQGMSLKAIRAAIDGRWAQTGPSTRTPYPQGSYPTRDAGLPSWAGRPC